MATKEKKKASKADSAKKKALALSKKSKKPAKKSAAADGKAKAKPGTYLFKAPADFKPHDLIVVFRTMKDGLIGPDFEAVRYQGRFDEEVDDRKKSVMSQYDPQTLQGLATRMGSLSFNANGLKFFPEDVGERTAIEKYKNDAGDKKERLVFRGKYRLPKNTTFRCLFRIGKKKVGEVLTCSLKRMWQQGESNKGRVVYTELEKTDPVVRMFRGAKRGGVLAPAFRSVLMPPKKTRQRKKAEDSDE